MLGKRGPQRGLFEADTAYGAFVGRDSCSGWLASRRGELFRDEAFAGPYVLDNGRPSVPPSLLAVALVRPTPDGVSDDEAQQRADYDLRWKVALGVELDARPRAQSTPQAFRAQLIVHEHAAVCAARPLRVLRVRATGRRTATLHPQERLLQAARAFQASPAFAEYRRRGQTVEHRIARLGQLAIRQARDVRRAKTAFQLLMAAAVAHLTYLAASTSADPGTLGLAALLVVLSPALGPTRRAEAPDAAFGTHPTSRDRQLTSLPTAFTLPGCRPGF